MATLLLLIHVSLALISLGYAGGVVMASRKRKLEATTRRVKMMWYGTITTIGSGICLSILLRSPIGATCTSLLAFLVVIMITHTYQKVVFQKAE